ncbi:MAG: hypothetical protein WA440_02805 [Ignavibacteriaceae bacterium]
MAQSEISQSVLSQWIVNKIYPDENAIMTLVMDRTNWKFGKSNIKYLVLSVCYKRMPIPLF